jgi:hypothetical protein
LKVGTTIVAIAMIMLICILPLTSTASAQIGMPGLAQLQKGSALQNKDGILFLALQVADTIPSLRNSIDANQFGLQYPAFGYLWINSQGRTGLVNLAMNPGFTPLTFTPLTWWTYPITLSVDNTGQQLCIEDFERPIFNIVDIQDNVLQTELVNPLSNTPVPNIGASFVIFGNPNCQTGLGMSIISAIWV